MPPTPSPPKLSTRDMKRLRLWVWPTLTSQELSDLEAIKSVSLVNFTVQDAEDYYSYLAGKGFAYGDLALGVVENNTAQGIIANAYAASVAAANGVDFSVGSAAWKTMQWNLMQADWTARDTNGGAEIDWQAYNVAHAAAFGEVGSRRNN